MEHFLLTIAWPAVKIAGCAFLVGFLGIAALCCIKWGIEFLFDL